MKKTYFIKTFGCQMNISDSERVASFMQSNGFSLANEIFKADIVIINTCGIRQMAEDRAFGLVRNLRKENSKIKIVVTGCLANRKDIMKRMNGVNLFSEIKDVENILEKLGFKKEDHYKYNRDYLKILPTHKNSFQAYVPIMTGCDNFCSYCVVPYARGREVSRPAKEIISEVTELINKGYLSITLLGQNVNSYISRSKNKEINFTKLLKTLDKIPGNFWLSFVSSHPKDMSDELIGAVTKLKKVCEWVHLPVQAGNDEILKKMNRNYTSKHYLGRIRKIKAEFKKNKPNTPFATSSDIIVGFPSETKNQFMDSSLIMEKSKFDMVFFGQFSPRPGTKAFQMKDNVSQTEKVRRENFLNEILKKTALANNKKYIGKELEILIEKEKNGFYFGHTRTQKNVKIKYSKKNLVGTFLRVTIVKARTWNLEGEVN